MFFDKYKDKKDGVIRGYDIRSPKTRVVAVIIMVICVLISKPKLSLKRAFSYKALHKRRAKYNSAGILPFPWQAYHLVC